MKETSNHYPFQRHLQIADPARRQLFLESVPVNRQIILAAREQG